MTTTWCLVIGVLLIGMGLTDTMRRDLPFSASALYLLAGWLIGPHAGGLLHLDLFADAKLLESLTEAAVLISLFAVGLRLRVRLTDRLWTTPLLLATVAMVLTIAGLLVCGTVVRPLAGRGDAAGGRARTHRPGAGFRRAGRRPGRPRSSAFRPQRRRRPQRRHRVSFRDARARPARPARARRRRRGAGGASTCCGRWPVVWPSAGVSVGRSAAWCCTCAASASRPLAWRAS